MSLPFLPSRCWPELLSKGLQVFDLLIRISHNTAFDLETYFIARVFQWAHDRGIHWSYHILYNLENAGLMA